MKKARENWILVANGLMLVAMIFMVWRVLSSVEWYMQVLAYGIAIIFSVGSIVFYFLRKPELSKTLFVLNAIAFIVIMLFSVLSIAGVFETFSDMESIKKIILSAGYWGYLIYSLMLILNVVLLPIPGFIFPLVGVAIYGPITAMIITYISFLIGSIIAFFIGRVLGQRAVNWCIGKENAEKYKTILGAKGNLLFVIMQILPFFPDDILCMVAGLTNMKFSFFITSMLILRPIYIVPVCLLSTGNIIPFSGWGIPVWIAIFIFFGVVFLLFCKHQAKIENYMKKLTYKFTKRRNKNG